MNDILNRLTVLLALVAFGVVAAVGFLTNVRPMVALFRATVAFAFFGFFGRMGLRVVLSGILKELARHKQEDQITGEAADEGGASTMERVEPASDEAAPTTE